MPFSSFSWYLPTGGFNCQPPGGDKSTFFVVKIFDTLKNRYYYFFKSTLLHSALLPNPKIITVLIQKFKKGCIFLLHYLRVEILWSKLFFNTHFDVHKCYLWERKREKTVIKKFSLLSIWSRIWKGGKLQKWRLKCIAFFWAELIIT